MRIAGVVVLALVACGSKKQEAAPSGPVPPLACDYHQAHVEHHTCIEVRDPAIVDAQRAWYGKIKSDKVTCAPNTRCPAEGRTAGCAKPNGNIKWSYTDDAAEVQRTCTTGKFLALGEAPPAMQHEVFRCASELVCQEIRSVVDLMPTVTAMNCKTAGSTFEKRACPTENVVGRCRVSGAEDETVWSFFAPRTAEDARTLCTQLEGTFVDK